MPGRDQESADFLSLLKADEDVAGKMEPAELEACFDDSYHTKRVDVIFDRVFAES